MWLCLANYSTNCGSEPRDEICCVISDCPLIKDFFSQKIMVFNQLFGTLSVFVEPNVHRRICKGPLHSALRQACWTPFTPPYLFLRDAFWCCFCVCVISHNWYPPFRFLDEIHIQTKHFIWHVFAQELIWLIRCPSFTLSFTGMFL